MTSSLQRDIFLAGEADQWFERNKAVLDSNRGDPVADALKIIGVKPKRVLEIGCANGWRLSRLRQAFTAECVGIDPSSRAIEQGLKEFAGIDLRVGAADRIPFAAREFDLVIFGFCFYLIDPDLHFQCVAEADRVLCDGGVLVISDFLTPFPYHNNYSHLDGVRSHKLEFSRYFLAHPGYNLIHRTLNHAQSELMNPDRREGIDILVKNMSCAFPPNPYKR